MIDSLVKYWDKIENSKIVKKYKLKKNDYVLATFHRPSNVDSDSDIKSLIEKSHFPYSSKNVKKD